MTTILDRRLENSLSPSIPSQLINSTESSLEESVETFHSKLNENVAALILQLQLAVENQCNEKGDAILKQIQDLQKNTADLTKLLSAIEGELSNPQTQHINLANHSKLIEDVNQQISHPLFEKTQWTRQEAETASKVLSRYSDQVVRQMNQLFTQANQEVEKRHDYLITFREILKIFQSLQKCLVDNQKAR